MKEKVLMLAWEYPPRIIGGLSRVVWALSKELAEQQGLEVHVVTADHPGTAEHEMDGKVHVHRVKTQTDSTPDFVSWVNRLNIGFLQYAIRLHRESPFDIIHAHDWMVTDAAWVLKSFDIPLVTTIHATEQGRMGGLHTDMQRYVNQAEWRLCFESWKIIVNSVHMKEELKNLFQCPADKVEIIPNGTDPSHFDFEFDKAPMRHLYAADHQKIVLYVGRLVNEKGVQTMISAAPMVLQHYPGTQFLVVGTGYFIDELKGLAGRIGVDTNVRFLGYVSDEDLLKLYKIADIVCIPSHYEPFGIVALEGMAANVPVVVSDVGGLRDFVEHMETGITTYAGNAQSLAWGLLEVLRNPDLAEKLRENAFSRVQNIYNWKSIAEKTYDVYRSVIESAKIKAKSEGSVLAGSRHDA